MKLIFVQWQYFGQIKHRRLKYSESNEIKFCPVARTDEGGAGEVLRTGENLIKSLPKQNLSKTKRYKVFVSKRKKNTKK